MSEKNFNPPPGTPDYLVRQAPGPEAVWNRLLEAATALDEALARIGDRVEYTGSLELASRFRLAVVEAHHVRGDPS